MAKKTKKAAAPVVETGPMADVRSEYYRLIALWIFALLLTGGEFVLVYRKFRPDTFLNEGRPSWMLIVLGLLAIAEFVGSIWIWRGIQLDAAKKRDLKLSQMGYLVAWLLCLAAEPLGFVIAQSSDGRYYFGFFILSALGVLYHQPTRETLAAAAPKPEPKPISAEPVTSETAPGEPIAADTAAEEPYTEEPAETVVSDHASGEENDAAAVN